MPEPASALPDFNAYVTVGQVVSELFELGWLDLDDFADRDFARLLAERLAVAAPVRQLPLALTA
ncbi:MAG: hypothetical protein F4Y29_11130 [Chloroflexi bacterium]|nr:hypothetical protein [Chloroflexota bacterium]MYJ01200.1 hypothetical protein [Chloroflexota bacterium]